MPFGDCPILFTFCNVGKVSYNWIGVRAVELDTENQICTVVCSSCHQYGKHVVLQRTARTCS